MKWVAALLALPIMAAEPAARIVYSKSFPGSVPPFVLITVEKTGEAVYKESTNDDQPLKFQLKPAEVDEIFALADKLDRFQRPLESPLKVANMGMKAFRWEAGGKQAEVKFNFSEDTDARVLTDWFERMTETVQHRISLERTVRFEKLGVNKVLLQLQAAMDRKRLVAPEQFLPWLDRVIKNESYLNMARERAALLAEAIRSPQAKVE